MIYTVTLNPSLDYIVDVENLTVGAINRSTKEAIYPGGKGINVSIILSRLGAETTVIGFKAGFTGENLEHLVQKEGIKAQLLSVEKGFTRINVKVRGKEETAINGAGPEVAEKELADLTTRLEGLGKMIPSSFPGVHLKKLPIRSTQILQRGWKPAAHAALSMQRACFLQKRCPITPSS